MSSVATCVRVANVLILEDDLDMREALRRSLPSDRYHLHLAETSTDAQRLLESQAYDVGVFDMRVPREVNDVATTSEGLAVLRLARAMYPALDLIVMSAVSLADPVLVELEQLGIRRRFEKPFDVTELSQEIDKSFARVSGR